ncbi:MAG: diguanylate cyclase [Leptolinea sp.]|nr:diguanylate cyclase [Leptolinea sp.]
MNYLITPHGLILFITAALSSIVSVVAWQRQYRHSGKMLTLFMLSIAVWALGSGVEVGVTAFTTKILWSKITYFGFVFAAPLCFLFIFSYTNNWKWIKTPYLIVIALMSLITLLLAWTNEYHGLIWSAFIPGDRQLNILIYEHGVWFWVFELFQLVLYVISLTILLKDLRVQKSPYREQTLTIIIATLMPAVAGVLYSLNISPIPGLDWMPIFTFFTGFLFTWSLYHHHLLDLVPVARDVLVDQMLDGMILLDDQHRIIDINPSARNMIRNGEKIKIGDTLSDTMPDFYASLTRGDGRSSTQILSFKETTTNNRFVDVRFTLIQREKNSINCSLLILRDITKRKNIEDSLNQANRELEIRLEEIQNLQAKLREESIRDPLTNLYNRRYLEDSLRREFAHAHREKFPVSIIMIDIDHFKRVNDTHGHTVGDRVLQELSNLLVASFRTEDIVCRYGGEEFIVVMPGASARIAFQRTEDFRKALEEKTMSISKKQINITISAGVAVYPSDGETVDLVISEADKSLYQAKASGRNRVIAGQLVN